MVWGGGKGDQTIIHKRGKSRGFWATYEYSVKGEVVQTARTTIKERPRIDMRIITEPMHYLSSAKMKIHSTNKRPTSL